jgi:chemotaxis response regulator CheB
VFAAQCQKALAGSNQQLLATVALAELVDATRRLAPDLVVLDADREDVAALKVLATKVMLVSSARIVLVSAYLAPGSPFLCALLQSIAASFVQKLRGPSWLGLSEDDRAGFVAALHAAFAASAGGSTIRRPVVPADLPPPDRDDVDLEWTADAAPPRGRP